jgi:hypothetical protein
VLVGAGNGLHWRELWKAEDIGKESAVLDFTEPVNGAYEMLIKVRMLAKAAAGDAVLKSIKVITTTQPSSKTQPRLNVGRNTVYVGAGGQTDSIVFWPELQGEKADGSKLPIWGSHLWRLRLPENKWEHLLAAPEALIAVGGTGKLIYALGYFSHVLYQYDCATGKGRSIRVGSVDGHVSRNFLVDGRDHVCLPRLTRPPGADARSDPAVHLVGFDGDLHEVGQTPLAHYLMGKRYLVGVSKAQGARVY